MALTNEERLKLAAENARRLALLLDRAQVTNPLWWESVYDAKRQVEDYIEAITDQPKEQS